MSPARPIASPLHRVALDGVQGLRWAWLREITGADEAALEGRDTPAAIALLDRLLVDRPGATVRPGEAALLTITDRDLLLAAVYRASFGARIGSTVACAGCGAPFDLDFDLD